MPLIGFRPITPEEYVVELKLKREENPNIAYTIKIWVSDILTVPI